MKHNRVSIRLLHPVNNYLRLLLVPKSCSGFAIKNLCNGFELVCCSLLGKLKKKVFFLQICVLILTSIQVWLGPQIYNRDRVLLGPIKVCQMKGERIHCKCPKFLHTIAKKERDWCIKFSTYIGRLPAVDLCCGCCISFD